jgi:hypothetical protein
MLFRGQIGSSGKTIYKQLRWFYLTDFFSRYMAYKNVCLLVCKAAPFLFRSGLGLDVPRK